MDPHHLPACCLCPCHLPLQDKPLPAFADNLDLATVGCVRQRQAALQPRCVAAAAREPLAAADYCFRSSSTGACALCSGREGECASAYTTHTPGSNFDLQYIFPFLLFVMSLTNSYYLAAKTKQLFDRFDPLTATWNFFSSICWTSHLLQPSSTCDCNAVDIVLQSLCGSGVRTLPTLLRGKHCGRGSILVH